MGKALGFGPVLENSLGRCPNGFENGGQDSPSKVSLQNPVVEEAPVDEGSEEEEEPSPVAPIHPSLIGNQEINCQGEVDVVEEPSQESTENFHFLMIPNCDVAYLTSEIH